MNRTEKMINNYLLRVDKEKENNGFSSIFEPGNECFKLRLEDGFSCKIDCALYDQAVNGVGNEKEKINVPHSSSLQSLLFFSNINKDNPLTIMLEGKPVEFDKVRFEYRNLVINQPSCIDVVLVDKTEKYIIFIESKLAEIARDSSKKRNTENEDNIPGAKVVGISYFMQDKPEKNGYYQSLKLSECDLKRIGIIFPEDEGEYPIKDRTKKGSNDAIITLPYYKCTLENENANKNYVYSYGIKQILSHIIGILSFKADNRDSKCSTEYRNYSEIENVYFMEVCNGFPGGEDMQEIRDIQDEYGKHIEVVYDVLKGKNLGITMLHKTYQEIYADRGAYKLSPKVVEFYHLDE